METPVVRDIPDLSDVPARAATPPARREPVENAHSWTARRFAIDPASSPHLMAAFAWNAHA